MEVRRAAKRLRRRVRQAFGAALPSWSSGPAAMPRSKGMVIGYGMPPALFLAARIGFTGYAQLSSGPCRRCSKPHSASPLYFRVGSFVGQGSSAWW